MNLDRALFQGKLKGVSFNVSECLGECKIFCKMWIGVYWMELIGIIQGCYSFSPQVLVTVC